MATIAHPYCDGCFTGVKHTGDPVGKTVPIADIPTYVSEPPSGKVKASKKVVLFFADVYGPLFLNNQLIQDYFTSHGFVVVGINYFLGDPVYLHTEEGFDFQAWVEVKRKKAVEIMPKWLEEVRRLYGSESKYCTVVIILPKLRHYFDFPCQGYCFGAPFVMNIGGTDDIVPDFLFNSEVLHTHNLAVFAHPGLLNKDHFRNLKSEDILEMKAKYEFQVFSGVEHSFAVRGDLDNPDICWAKEESARGIVGWFLRFSRALHGCKSVKINECTFGSRQLIDAVFTGTYATSSFVEVRTYVPQYHTGNKYLPGHLETLQKL
ncbi:hypothetical protein C8R43DRAFT_955109 [Mycena crocata]|nr:hypothetical protein C8R43DRAFT_955109 [Mycena crocata]